MIVSRQAPCDGCAEHCNELEDLIFYQTEIIAKLHASLKEWRDGAIANMNEVEHLTELLDKMKEK